MVRRDAPIVIQIAAAYKRQQKFRNETRRERSGRISLFSVLILRDAYFFFNLRAKQKSFREERLERILRKVSRTQTLDFVLQTSQNFRGAFPKSGK